jgi:hypothetical protein
VFIIKKFDNLIVIEMNFVLSFILVQYYLKLDDFIYALYIIDL